MTQKTAGFYGRSRFVVLKSLSFPRTFGIDRLDADVLASVFEECSSHSWSSKIKAGPSIFARRTSVRASTTLARVVPNRSAPHNALIQVIFSSVGKLVKDETVAALSQRGLAIGIKDATADLGRPARIRALCGTDFVQLSGDDATAAAYRAAGGDGCISVTANPTFATRP